MTERGNQNGEAIAVSLSFSCNTREKSTVCMDCVRVTFSFFMTSVPSIVITIVRNTVYILGYKIN